MLVVSNKNALKQWRSSQTERSLGFVPTMGALHKGHGSLIQAAREQNHLTAVSIFVNPLQFGPQEDLSKYPRTLEADLELCKELGVDLVFTPSVLDIYSDELSKVTTVKPRQTMANCLCGVSRPGHFEGVLTVVLKLFNLVEPHRAYFGEKDFQQLALIKAMVLDLNLKTEIVPMPIIREDSGLAMSSRNKYLSESDLNKAAEIYATLQKAQQLFAEGNSINSVIENTKQPYFEYFEARNPDNLKETNKVPARLFVAAKIGNTRLIDNIQL